MKILEQIIKNMHAKVEAQRHCYIVPEHLLLSITESHEFRKSMPLCDWRKIAGELEDFLSKNIPCGRERIVSPELRRLLE